MKSKLGLIFSLLILSSIVAVAQSPVSYYMTGAVTNTFHAYSGVSTIYTITVYNNDVSDIYIQVFNTNNVPSAGSLPSFPALRIPADSTGSYSFKNGVWFDQGISVGVSSTPTYFTDGGKKATASVTAKRGF